MDISYCDYCVQEATYRGLSGSMTCVRHVTVFFFTPMKTQSDESCCFVRGFRSYFMKMAGIVLCFYSATLDAESQFIFYIYFIDIIVTDGSVPIYVACRD